ncbi:MAG: monophosphatase [Solirubrobacteraceae bacterium]|nr:monophosphatase [Solirubrobacteraceae bacterium]
MTGRADAASADAAPAGAALAVDWLETCRRAATRARAALDRYPLYAERAVTAGIGIGGDLALVIDREVEDAVFYELEALGIPLTAISEERGEVDIAGGGPTLVVIDPIDGSRNAKRGLELFALSIAVASGPTMGDVDFGYVHDFNRNEDWWAYRGEGAWLAGKRLPALRAHDDLELVGLETIHPGLVADHAQAIAATGIARLRAIGSIALSLCYVAAGRLDGLVCLGATRSVDCAAGQLIVREAGGVVDFPEAAGDPLQASLDVTMRSRVVAAAGPAQLQRLLPVGAPQH